MVHPTPRSPPPPGFLQKIAALCSPERVRRYPLTVALIFFVVWIGAFLKDSPDGVLDGWGKFLGNDFVAFYTGGLLWRAGDQVHLYDMAVQQAIQQALTVEPLAQLSPFINPPYAALIYAPLTWLDYIPALLLWWALGAAAVVESARLMQRTAPGLSNVPLTHLLACVVGLPPTLLWLGYGQATPLVMLIWCVSLVALMKQRDGVAGVALGMLAFKPQLALGLVLVMCLGKRWRALAGGALGLAAWLGLGWFHAPEAMQAWWEMRAELAALLRAPSYPAWGVCSLYGFFNLLVYPWAPRLADVLTAVCSLAMLASLVKLWWRAPWAPDSPAWSARVAITLALAPLLAVQLYTYDLMLWCVPLWLMIGIHRVEDDGCTSQRYLDGGPILAWSALLALASFAVPPLLAAQVGAMERAGLPAVALQPIPLLVMAWCWAVYRRHVAAPAGVSNDAA